MAIKDEFNFENQQDLKEASEILLTITALFEDAGIEYYLEGGTLLGLVRDGEILPWDHDLDLSVNEAELSKVRRLKWKCLAKGFRLSFRHSKFSEGPIRKGSVSLIKIKPLGKPFLNFFTGRKVLHFVVCDVFVKPSDKEYYYWQAKRKIMRVARKYHDATDAITYRNRTIKVPNFYEEYLTEKYGDWSKPVKVWDCGQDEKTIWTPDSK